jgi:chromosome condensin MukBEF MukE localization factor
MNHRSVPSNVDKKALQTARDSLQRFLERISMVTKIDPFILENKTKHMPFVGIFRMF